jgi:hypothetical protein
MVVYSNLGHVNGSAAADANQTENGSSAHLPLPADAQRTLDQIADALGVTTALLRPHGGGMVPGNDVRLAEATELLQAFIRIHDPEARQRCVAFVHDAAGVPRAL